MFQACRRYRSRKTFTVGHIQDQRAEVLLLSKAWQKLHSDKFRIDKLGYAVAVRRVKVEKLQITIFKQFANLIQPVVAL
jgi:hypothetical protein